MDIYERLGVRKVINAAGTYTVIGGSRMSPKTLEDMKAASTWNVEIKDLQHKVHERIAEITNNEGAYVSNGAAAGLYLSVAAAISLHENRNFSELPFGKVTEKEVVTFSAHRNPYDWAMRQVGVKIKSVGYPNEILPMTEKWLKSEINDQTVAIYYVAGSHDGWVSKGALPFENVVKVSREKNIPLIVDAAAQLPPSENLWKYTKGGATVALFSGGKDLAGPQSSGLIVGENKLINEIKKIGFPNYGVGRMLKVGREEMVGLLSALEQYLEINFEDRFLWCENQIEILKNELDVSSLYQVERSFPNEAGQPIPRAFVRLTKSHVTSVRLIELLMEGENAIFTTSEGRNGIYINPMTLREGEIAIISKKLIEIEYSFLKEEEANVKS